MSEIDARIRQAVLFVLAGCHTSEPPAPTVVVEPAELRPNDFDAGAPAPAVLVDAEAFPRPVTAQSACQLLYEKLAASPGDPRKQTPVRTRSSPQQLPTTEGVIAAHEMSHQLECVFGWGQEPTSTQITIVPSCCPPHPVPCPPATTQTMQTTRTKVQTLILNKDPTQPKLEVFEWVVFDPTPPRHMCGRRPEGIASSDGR